MKIDLALPSAARLRQQVFLASGLFLFALHLASPQPGLAQTPILPTDVFADILPAPPDIFNQPQHIAYAGGRIYVSDISGYVRAFDVATGAVVAAYTDSGLAPYGVAVDNKGLVYAADPFRNEVVIWNNAGAKIGSFSGRTDSSPYGAKGVAVNDQRKEVWVGNLDNHLIEVHRKAAPHEYKKQLRYFWADKGNGLQRYSLAGPTYLTFLPGGDLLVVDTIGSGVFRFRPDFREGEEPTAVAAIVVDFASLKATGISADAQGHVYLSANAEHAIRVYDSDLNLLYYLGDGSEPFWFNGLYGLASSTAGQVVTLWAVDGTQVGPSWGVVHTLQPLW